MKMNDIKFQLQITGQIPVEYDLVHDRNAGPIVIRTIMGMEIVDMMDRMVPRNWVM